MECLKRLKETIQQVFTENRGRYGSPRLHRVLQQQARRVGHNRVARLMRELGLRVVSKKRWQVSPTFTCPIHCISRLSLLSVNLNLQEVLPHLTCLQGQNQIAFEKIPGIPFQMSLKFFSMKVFCSI